ncbi:RNA pseudouridylate synthase family protein [Babesia caballi]|uniref:RNA pseudouridylate synthase family protein n=1 Tax=Babesia caballi TaxID=5871 RepID=A0AAV4LVF6_BABCB|nr:RNA pseudouridylate synthase family protein [Babesia caballi]
MLLGTGLVYTSLLVVCFSASLGCFAFRRCTDGVTGAMAVRNGAAETGTATEGLKRTRNTEHVWQPAVKHRKRLRSQFGAAAEESELEPSASDPQPTYHFKDGFRIVLPYDHVYKSFTKGRWFGRRLYDVMSAEFAAFTDDYVRHACARGLMKVFDRQGNDLYPEPGEQVLDHVCRPNEVIWHLAVVHEQLALDTQVRVLSEDEDYIVVSKPCSLPVYHTGTYHFNTLVEVLKREVLGDRTKQLYPVHRLDKLTSGVIFLAKNRRAASSFCEAIRNDRIRKVYLARVRGDFSRVLDEHECLTLADGVGEGGGRVACCRGFMRVVSHKLSVHEFTLDEAKTDLKSAETRFRMLAYNPALGESLLLCYPVTGRTHQIRAHLKFLGFPISNDRCYNDAPLCDSRGYFRELPAVHWELDEQGRWRLPELGFVAPEPAQLMQGSRDYHVGLNKPVEGLHVSPTGIFLHAFRYVWVGERSVSDSPPEWVRDFDIGQGSVDLAALDLWLKSSEGAAGQEEPAYSGSCRQATEVGAAGHPTASLSST